MIINTGLRTDIPAFYSKWFINRIKAGFVMVRNPYNPKQIFRYSLDPKVVDCLLFCTKNPEPLLSHLDILSKYNTFWYVTITPYGKDIEPNVPNKDVIINSFKTLKDKLPNAFIGWRYDPIFFNKNFDIEAHIEAFRNIADKLNGYTDICVISFLDLYEKVRINAPNLKVPTIEEQLILAQALLKIAKKNNMQLYACCEDKVLAEVGLNITGCNSQELIESSIGYKLDVPNKNKLRQGCSCLLGNDIGAYNTCKHCCIYCYANSNMKTVVSNTKNHFPDSPLLIGRLQSTDEIFDSKQESYKVKEEQITLF